VARLDFDERSLDDGARFGLCLAPLFRLPEEEAKGADRDFTPVIQLRGMLHSAPVDIGSVLASEINDKKIFPALGMDQRVVPGNVRVGQHDVTGWSPADAATLLYLDWNALGTHTFQPGKF
jgi:hypothetical protein